jgi:hypothetical protein
MARGPVTIGALGLITTLALLLKDVGFIVSLSGASMGIPIMFIIPPIMSIVTGRRKRAALAAISAETGTPIAPRSTGEKVQRVANYSMILTG